MAFMNGLLIFIGWIFNDLQRLYRVALGKYTNFVIKKHFPGVDHVGCTMSCCQGRI